MSTLTNKIFSNTFWQLLIRIINILIGVFSLALITRILGQTGFGYYTTVFAFVHMVMIFADLGLYLVLLREISTTEDGESEQKITNNIFTIRFVTALFILALTPLLVQIFPYDAVVKNAVIFLIATFFFQSLVSTLTAVFAKYLVMPKVALVDLFNKILYFFILLYLFSQGSSLNFILGANSLTMAISFFIFFIFLRKYIKLNFAWDFNYWRKVFYLAWPLAVTVVLNLIYFKADTLILAAYWEPTKVGLYGAPYRVLEVISTFPHMFMGLILPLFTASWISNEQKRLNNILQNSFDFFVIICLGLIFGAWLISTPLMVLLAGPDFALSGPILNILIVATSFIFFGTLFTYLIVAIKKQKEMIKYFLTTAVLGLLGYFYLIPKFHYWAAAGVTLIVEIMIGIFAWVVVKKYFNFQLNFKILGKATFSAITTFAICYSFRDMNIFLTILMFIILYFSLLYWLKAIDKKLIKELLNR